VLILLLLDEIDVYILCTTKFFNLSGFVVGVPIGDHCSTLYIFLTDPYCGWCSLENKCSLRGDCRDAAQDPLYWISYKSGRCTTITSVQPQELQRTTARTLSLVIDNLPTLAGQFVCVFQALGKTLVTNATR